jgi:hypothetical protein
LPGHQPTGKLNSLQSLTRAIYTTLRDATPVSGLGHPDEYRPAPVQIDTDDLPSVVVCLHGGDVSFTVR